MYSEMLRAQQQRALEAALEQSRQPRPAGGTDTAEDEDAPG